MLTIGVWLSSRLLWCGDYIHISQYALMTSGQRPTREHTHTEQDLGSSGAELDTKKVDVFCVFFQFAVYMKNIS